MHIKSYVFPFPSPFNHPYKVPPPSPPHQTTFFLYISTMQFTTLTVAASLAMLQQVAAYDVLPEPALVPMAVITPAPTAENVHIQRRGVTECLLNAVSSLHLPTPAAALTNYILADGGLGANAPIATACAMTYPASLSSEVMDFASKAQDFLATVGKHEPGHCGTSVAIELQQLCTAESLTYVFTSASSAVSTGLVKQAAAPTKIVLSDDKSGAVSARGYSAGMLAAAAGVAFSAMML